MAAREVDAVEPPVSSPEAARPERSGGCAAGRRQDGLTRAVLRLGSHCRDAGEFIGALGLLLDHRGKAACRLFASLQSLHPVFRARSYIWHAGWAAARATDWPHGLANRPGYDESPDYRVHRSKKPFRIRLSDSLLESACDLYGQLKREGFTDYLMIPLVFSDGTVNTFAFATREPSGFTVDLSDALIDLALPLTAVFERFVAAETAAATLTAYLGRGAARHVLDGTVQAGQGQLLEAVILFGDLRGYTTLSAALSPQDTVALLNEYFDCIVEAVEDRGGQVLKFIGDAFLAVFPLEERGKPICAAATTGAVEAIRHQLCELNRKRADGNLPRLTHGMAIHFGPVVYGNVGSSRRLDFTVIGQEVNVAARVQEATKVLGVDYLFTGEYVAAFGEADLVPLGPYELRELGRTVQLYTPKEGGK